MLQVKPMRLRIRYGRTVGRKGISVVVTVVWAAVSSRWMGENGVNAKRKPKKPVQQHRAQSVFSRPARQFYGLTVRRGRSGRIGSAKHTVFFPFRINFRTVPIRAVCPVVTLSENLIIKNFGFARGGSLNCGEDRPSLEVGECRVRFFRCHRRRVQNKASLRPTKATWIGL